MLISSTCVITDDAYIRVILPLCIHMLTSYNFFLCRFTVNLEDTKGLEHQFPVAAVNQAGQGPFVTSHIIEPSKYAAPSLISMTLCMCTYCCECVYYINVLIWQRNRSIIGLYLLLQFSTDLVARSVCLIMLA